MIINFKEESGAEDLCLTEKIKDDKNCVGIIIKSEKFVESPDVTNI